MKREIAVQELIDKVKADLLAAKNGKDYPLFLIEKVEIELAVKVTAEGSGGINISVVELGAGISKEQAHIIRVTLTPIISEDEIREMVSNDRRLKEKILETSRVGLLKGGTIGVVGSPD